MGEPREKLGGFHIRNICNVEKTGLSSSVHHLRNTFMTLRIVNLFEEQKQCMPRTVVHPMFALVVQVKW